MEKTISALRAQVGYIPPAEVIAATRQAAKSNTMARIKKLKLRRQQARAFASAGHSKLPERDADGWEFVNAAEAFTTEEDDARAAALALRLEQLSRGYDAEAERIKSDPDYAAAEARANARKLFAEFDANGDGVLDLGEFTTYLVSVFTNLSRGEETAEAFASHGCTPQEMAEATAMQCFVDADTENTGVLSFDEFSAWIDKGQGGNGDEERAEVGGKRDLR